MSGPSPPLCLTAVTSARGLSGSLFARGLFLESPQKKKTNLWPFVWKLPKVKRPHHFSRSSSGYQCGGNSGSHLFWISSGDKFSCKGKKNISREQKVGWRTPTATWKCSWTKIEVSTGPLDFLALSQRCEKWKWWHFHQKNSCDLKDNR